MKIVIDIPDGIYDTIQADEMISREQLAVLQMHILKGTPLPKGHGRIADTDVLDKIIVEIETVKSIVNNEIINHNRKDLINLVSGLNQSLVIIDKYKSESEG